MISFWDHSAKPEKKNLWSARLPVSWQAGAPPAETATEIRKPERKTDLLIVTVGVKGYFLNKSALSPKVTRPYHRETSFIISGGSLRSLCH